MIFQRIPLYLAALLLSYSCAAQKPAANNSFNNFIRDDLFRSAHVGVSVYDVASAKYLYDYQGDKYFVPASNVKIITCFAAMKYLKHILPGIRYYENDTAVYLLPTGDPSLLHRDFLHQPVIEFLQKQTKYIYISDQNWKDKELGEGWSWDDYSDEYMTERNALPVYGNTIQWIQEKIKGNIPGSEESVSVYSDPEINWKVRFEPDPSKKTFKVKRERTENIFTVTGGNEKYKELAVPFVANGIQSALELLKDTTGKEIKPISSFSVPDPIPATIWSQPVDSLLKPMMYRSDNFFAEQLLLMVSGELTGVMSDELITDTLLNTDMNFFSRKPIWVDGSGLSRYNLFTPKNFTEVLNRMQAEFGMDRVKTIFPTGDSGTLKAYYVDDNGKIYAKTGSMSGVIALSGYIYTKKNRLLLFSVLINNYHGSGASARRSIERFVKGLR